MMGAAIIANKEAYETDLMMVSQVRPTAAHQFQSVNSGNHNENVYN